MNVSCQVHPGTAPRPQASEWLAEPFHSLEDGAWDRLVDSHPDASVFHTSGWARVIHGAYGHTPLPMVCRDQSGEPAALLPLMEVTSCVTGRRGVSMPFADVCAPLFLGRAEHRPLMQMLRSVGNGRRWKYIELRGGPKPAPLATPSVSYYTHTLDLQPDRESITAGFDGSCRQALRKAEREGVVCEIRTDEEALRIYYELHARTRRRHGSPPQPWAFFSHLWTEFIRSGRGFVTLGLLHNRPVAGAVFLHTARHAVFKFGACDERHLEVRANNLVMASAIHHLSAHGMRTLHFGRTSMHQTGLRRFKLGWGAAEQVLSYFKYELRNDSWVAGADRTTGWQQPIFSRLPRSLNRLAGRLLYPHLD